MPAAATSTAVVAASEYAGATPAIAITTVSVRLRAPASSPLPLLWLIAVLLSVCTTSGGAEVPGGVRGWGLAAETARGIGPGPTADGHAGAPCRRCVDGRSHRVRE
ncbi:hypothetical protein GCM10020256_03500 [Streptomyces thermocoprophilus]